MVSVRVTFQRPSGARAAVVLTAPDLDAAVRDARREDGASAASEDEPEGAEEFGHETA